MIFLLIFLDTNLVVQYTQTLGGMVSFIEQSSQYQWIMHMLNY
jgi:hypothetical protein